MPQKKKRLLVIDASVARAAGGAEATAQVSRECRDFLSTVLTVCHQIVMTPEISEEWNPVLPDDGVFP